MPRLPHASVLARGMALHWKAQRHGDPHDRALSTAGLRLLWQLAIRHGLGVVGRAADHALVPGFRRVVPRAPVFVVAPPRSGTTLLYSLLARDPRFVGPKLYESLLQSVSTLALVDTIARRLADTRVGRGFARNQAQTFEESDAVHRIRYDELEEDTPLFDRFLVCPTALRCFPHAEQLAPLMMLDDRPEPVRREVMRRYYRTVQRLVHRSGGRTYLAKNIASAGRIGSLLETFPDARMIHIVRHPYRTLPSAIRLLQLANYMGLQPEARPRVPATHPFWRAHVELLMDAYQRLLAWERRLPAERWLTLRFEELVGDPMGTVRRVYDHFGMELSPQAEAAITQEAHAADRHRSAPSHRPQLEELGLTRAEVRERMRDVFDAYGLER